MVIGVPLYSDWPLLLFKVMCFLIVPKGLALRQRYLTWSRGAELMEEADSCLSKMAEVGFLDFF